MANGLGPRDRLVIPYDRKVVLKFLHLVGTIPA